MWSPCIPRGAGRNDYQELSGQPEHPIDGREVSTDLHSEATAAETRAVADATRTVADATRLTAPTAKQLVISLPPPR